MLINDENINQQTVLEIGKFSILWNMFERYKCDNDCRNDKLVDLAESLQVLPQMADFSVVLKHRAYTVWGITEEPYVNDHLDISHRLNENYKVKIKNFIETGSDIAGCLLAMYKLRNNMFHGLKNWRDLNNQIELFKSMNAILEVILAGETNV